MNNNNNINMSKLLDALSKMSKSELENGISKASEFLKSKNKDDIINKFKKE